MTVTAEATITIDDAVNPPQPPAVTARQVGTISAKSTALVVAVAAMWLIVLAIITLV
jgi:hypothetical protein